MKHIEEVPWWICDEGDVNYCAYVDTDSNYFNAEPLLRHLYPTFDKMGIEEKDDALEKIALQYQDIITEDYDRLARDCFNVNEHRLEMKTECVIRSAYFRATRRYAQWITKQEGIAKETLDVKGLEFKKANFPPILGDFFRAVLVDVLKGSTQTEIDERVKVFRKQILDGTIPLTKLGNPTSVKTLNKYTERKARAGEMFSTLAKGAPASVRATVKYNDLLRFWGLDKQHSYIVQGDKVKWVYLKDNPYKIDGIAFLDFDLPEKINTFIEQYADRRKIFESILLNKLEGFYDDLDLEILFISPSKDVIGSVLCENFQLDNTTLPIYDTKKLNNLISICQGDVLVEVEKINNVATKLNLSDMHFNLTYALSDMLLIPKVGSVNEPDGWEVEINLESEDVAQLIRAKSALSDVDNMTFKTGPDLDGNLVCEVVFGDGHGHSNKITYQLNGNVAEGGIDIPFDSNMFKTILSANKDMEEGTLKLAKGGLLKLNFKTDDVSSEYYMIRRAETDF